MDMVILNHADVEKLLPMEECFETMADKLGTLEKGKLADVLVVAANPLADIQNLRKMRLVIADGQVVRDNLRNP